MCKAEVDECQNLIMKILHKYGEATWHISNLDKSSITFGEKVGGKNQKKNPKHRGAGAIVTTWGFLNVSMVKNVFPSIILKKI